MEVSEPIFVFEAVDPPRHLTVFPSLADALDSIESLDVSGEEAAFTASGRVLKVIPTAGVFASLKLTEDRDVERLHGLLQLVSGPQHLAGEPRAYALEWLGQDDEDARRPPFFPRRGK